MLKHSTDITFYYLDCPITARVSYGLYVGSTSASGDDPTVVEVQSVIDGTGSEIVNKLDASILADFEDSILDELDTLNRELMR